MTYDRMEEYMEPKAFASYQKHWNALKKAVQTCVTPTPTAIEMLVGIGYTAKEAETEIENWLFEAAMQNVPA